MPMSNGFNHVATVTADLDRIVGFYRDVFDAHVVFEMAATDDHPRMTILDLGGGGALNVTEQLASTIVGDAPRQAAAARSTTTASPLHLVPPSTRSATGSSPPAPISATFTSWAISGRCSFEIPMAWSSRYALRPDPPSGSPDMQRG